LRDVVASQLGDKVDIFIFESGTEDILGPQGIYLVIDEKNPELTLWVALGRLEEVGGGRRQGWQAYGVPVIGNADSFGYFPDKIGAPASGEQDISWQMVFDSDKTRGASPTTDLDLLDARGGALSQGQQQGQRSPTSST